MSSKPRCHNWLKTSLIAVLLLSFTLSGCSGLALGPQPTTTPTATQAPTQTPMPTSTATPTATETPLPTATATATATPDLKATENAQATATVAAQIEKIKPDLEKYGIDLQQGHLVWSSNETITVQSTTYMETHVKELDQVGKPANFVIQSKVTWTTKSGLAGCGIIFRSEDDLEKGAHNFLEVVRLQFAPAWMLNFYNYGKFQYTLHGNPVFTNQINDKNDSSNVITLVVNGQNIVPYINGEKQRLVEDTKRKDGKIGLASLQESGETTCKFNETWVWGLDQ